jgi:hypothetical protein
MPLACRPVIAQLLDYLRANSQYDVDAVVAARSVVLSSLGISTNNGLVPS